MQELILQSSYDIYLLHVVYVYSWHVRHVWLYVCHMPVSYHLAGCCYLDSSPYRGCIAGLDICGIKRKGEGGPLILRINLRSA